jgi:Spy/CpxP family protein refolding chaperone
MQEAFTRAREQMRREKLALARAGTVLRHVREPLARLRTELGRMPVVAGMLGGDYDTIAMLKMHADELELTDEQKGRIGEIKSSYRRDAIERDAAIEIAQLDLEELEGADAPDLAAIEGKMREIADLKIERRMAEHRIREEVHGLLTAEQLEKVEELERTPLRRLMLRRYGVGDDEDGFSWLVPDVEHFDIEIPEEIELEWTDELDGPVHLYEDGDAFIFRDGGEFDVFEVPEGDAFFLQHGELEDLEEMIESGEVKHLEIPEGDVYIWVSPDGDEHRIEIRKSVKKRQAEQEEEGGRVR